MNKRQTLFLSWLIAYVYIAIKYSVLVRPSKFVNDQLDYMVIALLYFIPVWLFTWSAWLAWVAAGAGKGVWARVIAGIAMTYMGYRMVFFLYDFLDLPFGNYFDKLNEGFHADKSDDFRLEYLVVFALNLAAYVFLADKKLHAWRQKKD